MKKFFTKIAGVALGLAMAIGVGVAVASNREAVPVEAVSSTSTYQLIKSTDDLVSGCNYVIGATHSGSGSSLDYFISTQNNGNNRKVTTSTVTSEVVTLGDSIMNFTLGGDSTNGWTFFTTNYLNGSGDGLATQGFLDPTNTTSSNYLKIVTGNSASNYAKYSVSITNAGVATLTSKGKTSHNIMYFNYNSGSPMISCYGSKSKSDTAFAKVKIYKEIVPVTGLSISDGENSYNSNTGINLYENVALNLEATVSPNTASNKTVTWSTTGNISGSNGSYNIGAYSSGTTATVTCTTNGKDSSNNSKSVTLTITILQDVRTIDGIVIEGLDYNGVTFYAGHSSWDLDGVVYKAHFNNDTTETITGEDLNNLAYFFYEDDTLSNEVTSPVKDMTSVYLYVMYDGTYGEADGGITLETFEVVASSANYSRTAASKTSFTTAQKFTFGGTVTETWNYGTVNTYDEDDVDGESNPILTFAIVGKNSPYTRITDIKPGDDMLLEYNDKKIAVYFGETLVGDRYTITVSEAFNKTRGEYHLLTDASQLEVGSHIVIAAADADYMMKDGFTSTNNITGVAASKNATTSTLDKSKALDIELIEGSSNSSFGFKLEDGKGLYAGTSSNYLKKDTIPSTMTDAFSFSLTYSSAWTIKCQASSGRNYLRYNPNNGSPIFSCYTNSTDQAAVMVYLFIPYTTEANNYAETFIKGNENAGTCAATISSWSSLGTAYGKLTPGAQNLFESEETHNPEDSYGSTEYSVAHAVARYDLAIRSHSELRSNEFMGRFGEGKVNPSLSSVVNAFGINESESTPLIILIISLVGLTAVGGCFILRKRKQQ